MASILLVGVFLGSSCGGDGPASGGKNGAAQSKGDDPPESTVVRHVRWLAQASLSEIAEVDPQFRYACDSARQQLPETLLQKRIEELRAERISSLAAQRIEGFRTYADPVAWFCPGSRVRLEEKRPLEEGGQEWWRLFLRVEYPANPDPLGAGFCYDFENGRSLASVVYSIDVARAEEGWSYGSYALLEPTVEFREEPFFPTEHITRTARAMGRDIPPTADLDRFLYEENYQGRPNCDAVMRKYGVRGMTRTDGPYMPAGEWIRFDPPPEWEKYRQTPLPKARLRLGFDQLSAFALTDRVKIRVKEWEQDGAHEKVGVFSVYFTGSSPVRAFLHEVTNEIGPVELTGAVDVRMAWTATGGWRVVEVI